MKHEIGQVIDSVCSGAYFLMWALVILSVVSVGSCTAEWMGYLPPR